MTFINKTLIIFALLISSVLQLHGQDEEFKMELGGMLGGCFYMGDANFTIPFKNMGIAAGVVWRYNFNPRMALKADLAMGRISGDTRNAKTVFPEGQQISFKRNVFDLGAQFEYNFWGYSWGERFRGNKRFTPYILGGFGFTFAPSPAEGVFTVNFPLGVGLKYKISRRLNIGCEFTMRFSLSDKLDVTNKEGLQLKDPYGIKGSGFKNKDSYSFTTIFITYDFFRKCKGCNPDR